jgi:uracil phosphoribosyltransferase
MRAGSHRLSSDAAAVLGGSAAQDVIYERLPADIAERHVLLMDPVLSTGHSVARAIEVRQVAHAAHLQRPRLTMMMMMMMKMHGSNQSHTCDGMPEARGITTTTCWDAPAVSRLSPEHTLLPPYHDVQVLLARGVREERIMVLCIIAAPEGISRVCGRYPALRVVTSEIDSHVDAATFTVVPGCGEFGDRYFSS